MRAMIGNWKGYNLEEIEFIVQHYTLQSVFLYNENWIEE